MSYRIMGSSNGCIYDRAERETAGAAIACARQLVRNSIGTTAVLEAWVVDPHGREIYSVSVDARTDEVLETDLRERERV